MAPSSKRIASKMTGSPSTQHHRRRRHHYSVKRVKTVVAQTKKEAAATALTHPNRGIVVDNDEDGSGSATYWEVETIVGRRTKRGIVEFLIRWKGCTAEDDTWEPESHLCDSALREAQQQQQQQAFAQTTKVTHEQRRRTSKKEQVHLQHDTTTTTTNAMIVENNKLNPIARRRKLRGDPIDPHPKDAFDYNPGGVVFCSDDNEQQQHVSENGDLLVSSQQQQQPCSEEIPPFLSNLFSGAIQGVHAQLGIELLTQLLALHNYIPNDNLIRTMYETVLYGPKSDGTLYPDSRKVELIANYLLKACRSNPELRTTLIDMATSSWVVIEETLHQGVDADIYTCPGDDAYACSSSSACSNHAAALSRIANSLQVKASGLNLLLELMKYQLKPFIMREKHPETIRDQPIVRAFMEFPNGGIRGAFKYIVRMNITAWTRYGHFILGDSLKKKLYTTTHHEAPPSLTIVQSCSKHARNVIQTLAKIITYTAWMYSVVEKESMKEKKFASIIVDVLHSELNKSNNNKSVEFPQTKTTTIIAKKQQQQDKYWERMKLRFVLDLDLVKEEFSKPFSLTVATVLGLHKKYHYLFS